MTKWGMDDTNGVVIGEIDTRNKYMFLLDGKAIYDGYFHKDKEAIADFKDKYPIAFGQGVEMRVYGGSK